ncbi:MAG TPA: metallopeptidase family protein [Longimicrobiales bacterium]|nr:metallopeptidase family protein [Longimicrobiales bacterium]
MDISAFERRARAVWEEVPPEYREGVDGLVVARDACPHPALPDTYTLGECVTETYPSEYDGPDNVRSVVVLYYGSFRHVAADDPDFDWEYEIWETITHEIRHHLESLADEDDLEEVDYAADENFKRLAGEPFDPEFYRFGEEAAPGVFVIEQDVFLEVPYASAAEPRPWIEFEWRGRPRRVATPEALGDVCFLQIVDGLDAGSSGLCLVLVRRRGTLALLRDWLRRRRPTVTEAEGVLRG